MKTKKRSAVLAEYSVCESMSVPVPKVGIMWQHPRLPEVSGTVQHVEIEDRFTEVVWVAKVAKWVLE